MAAADRCRLRGDNDFEVTLEASAVDGVEVEANTHIAWGIALGPRDLAGDGKLRVQLGKVENYVDLGADIVLGAALNPQPANGQILDVLVQQHVCARDIGKRADVVAGVGAAVSGRFGGHSRGTMPKNGRCGNHFLAVQVVAIVGVAEERRVGSGIQRRASAFISRFAIITVMLAMTKTLFSTVTLLGLLAACGASIDYIPGTKVERTQENQAIIKTVEDYRLAVERKDSSALLLMASKDYWEDSGTPSGADDYGYDGLREVLLGRFQVSSAIRYSMRYMTIKRRGNRAFVDVLIDASYTVIDARGLEKREDKRDQNQLVLRWEDDRWLFLSGM